MKNILYFLVASVFIGTSILTVDIGIMHLSLFRLGIILVFFYMLLNIKKLNFKKCGLRIEGKFDLIIKFYFFWFIYGLISLFWVENLKLGLRAVSFLGAGVFCIFLFSLFINKKEDFRVIFNITFLMVVLHNILGWFEIITGKYFFADLEKIDRFNRFSSDILARRPVGIFSNTNDFATLMMFGAFISLIIFLNSKKIPSKILSGGTIISCIILISRSRSRANMIAIFLGFSAIFIILLYKKFGKKALRSLGFILLIFFLAFFFINSVSAEVNSKIVDIIESRSSTQKSNSTRINLIKNGFVFLYETFGFGTGAGNLEYWLETRSHFDIGTVYNIHNWWLEILSGYGILVFIGYLYIYVLKIKVLADAYLKSKDPFIRNISLGLLGFLVAYIIGSLSSSSNMYKEWIWIVWAIIVSFIVYISKDYEENKSKLKKYK